MLWFAIVATVLMAFTMLIFRTHFTIGKQAPPLNLNDFINFY